MGRVTTEALIENLEDLWAERKGQLLADRVRRIQVDDALVDTGATMLAVPKRLIRQLGLREQYRKPIRSSIGLAEIAVYDAVRLTIMERTCTMEVMEVPDDCSVLIGQIPLEQLDFVDDPQARKLIGNPRHGGEHIIEMY
jgi:predicted aspartyl protease